MRQDVSGDHVIISKLISRWSDTCVSIVVSMRLTEKA